MAPSGQIQVRREAPRSARHPGRAVPREGVRQAQDACERQHLRREVIPNVRKRRSVLGRAEVPTSLVPFLELHRLSRAETDVVTERLARERRLERPQADVAAG